MLVLKTVIYKNRLLGFQNIASLVIVLSNLDIGLNDGHFILELKI